MRLNKLSLHVMVHIFHRNRIDKLNTSEDNQTSQIQRV